jgi:co-chaperonin GroES (HSP10)
LENASGIFPAGYRVLVKPDKIEETTEGGIIIAQQHQEQYQRAQQVGTIIAMGPCAYFDQPQDWCEEGDRVMFSRYEGDIVTGTDGEDYRVINDKAVICHAADELRMGEFDRRTPYDGN